MFDHLFNSFAVSMNINGAGWFNAIRPILDRSARFLNQLLRDFLKSFLKSLPSSFFGNFFTNLVKDFLDWLRSIDPVCTIV